MTRRVVLAYSGSLETSAAIPWLAEAGAEVVALTLDLGQGRDLEAIRDRALAAGAARAHVLDVRDDLARGYVLPALQAGVLRGGGDPLAAALGQALVARTLVDVAAIERADAVAHGAAGRGHGRIERCVRALNRGMAIVAPARDWAMTQAELLEYARRRHVHVPSTALRSAADTLWGRSLHGGAPDDTQTAPPESAYTMTKPLARAPEAPALVELAFERGVPVAINGVPMPLTEIIESLSLIAGQHGVGRVEIVEPGLTEGGTQERYEAPAAVVLHAAHRALEALVLPADLALVKRELAERYTALVHEGGWFTPLREALDAFIATTQERVTGLVPVKLSKAQHVVVGCTSPHASHDDARGPEPALAAPGMVSRA